MSFTVVILNGNLKEESLKENTQKLILKTDSRVNCEDFTQKLFFQKQVVIRLA